MSSNFLDRRTVLAAGLGLAAASFANAQSAPYPNRPVKLMVGYAAGGGVDAVARMLSQRLPALLGQQVVVENRAGAAGMIAADNVAKSAPDGYTLLLGESALLVTPHLRPDSPLDPLKAFTPVAGTFLLPLMIVGTNSLPASNPKELVALLKGSPGKYSYATSGVGTVHHLGFEMMKARSGAFAVHIPYRGASQIVPDVVSGQVPLGVVSAAAGSAMAKSGRLKAIAMMNTGKVPGAENVAPLADALPGFNVAPRLMLMAPAGTPQAVVDRLNEAVRTVLASPELAQAAAAQGAVPAYMPPAQLASDIVRESGEWARLIKAQKIVAE